jgi:hypothetical protein
VGILIRGPESAPILVLYEPSTETEVFPKINWFGKLCRDQGFEKGDLCLMGLCSPLPKDSLKSAAKKWAHVEQYKDAVLEKINELQPKCVVTFGELATRVLTGHATAITKARGIPIKDAENRWIFPMLSPQFVRRIPDHEPVFRADLAFLKKFMDSGFEYEKPEVDYSFIYNANHYYRFKLEHFY